MDIDTLLELAKGWNALGWAVQEQGERLLAGEGQECNPNALRLLQDWFRAAARADVEGAETCQRLCRQAIGEERS